MNIFVLHTDPRVAASLMCDKHVVKMPLETAQILCTVSHAFDVAAPYKPTHEHHPCVRWAGATLANWTWCYEHLIGLNDEFEHRYGHRHRSSSMLEWFRDVAGKPSSGELKPFVQAMPDDVRDPDAVVAYRRYYRKYKAAMATWSQRFVPTWMYDDE